MPRVRSVALSGLLVLSLLGLTSCGSDDSKTDSVSALNSIKIEGKAGVKPKVTFDGKVEVDKQESKVLIKGDGETVVDGDTVSLHIWVGNGFTQKESLSTYDQGPQSVELTKDVLPPLREAMIDHKVGDRVAVLTSTDKAYGEGGNPSLKLGSKDAVLFVVDILGKVEVLDAPQGEEKTPAGWAPTVIEKDGVVTGLDFTEAHKPTGELIATTLVKGDGPVVKKDQTVFVHYLGQVYDAEKPFDENFSTGQSFSFPLGGGQVIAGWDERLAGRTVGSRVILEIPPNKGYGETGQPDAGIKGTDTLFFVVDILGAS